MLLISVTAIYFQPLSVIIGKLIRSVCKSMYCVVVCWNTSFDIYMEADMYIYLGKLVTI